MRTGLKSCLAAAGTRVGRRPRGATILIYHRVGGGSPDERDVRLRDFDRQTERLLDAPVVSLDEAVARLSVGDVRPSVVLTFDDGFRDVYDNAWPLLRERSLPFTIYVASGHIGGTMHWEGSTARDTGAAALSWDQLGEMVASGLCTVGNHTHTHARPEALDEQELDRCAEVVQRELGVFPRHFAYPWGLPVPRLDRALRARFDSAVTGRLGRNSVAVDPLRLKRIPVRGSDPLPFFDAKLFGSLAPERAYAAVVGAAKRAGVPA